MTKFDWFTVKFLTVGFMLLIIIQISKVWE